MAIQPKSKGTGITMRDNENIKHCVDSNVKLMSMVSWKMSNPRNFTKSRLLKENVKKVQPRLAIVNNCNENPYPKNYIDSTNFYAIILIL